MLILRGKDAYLRQMHLRRLRDAIESERGSDAVDVLTFDGGTAAAHEVLDEVRSFGLMQQYKIVVVDSANLFLQTDEHRSILERYVESPADEATLVLRADAWNPGKLDDLVVDSGVGGILKCDAPDEAEAVSFCRRRAEKQYRCTMNEAAARRLIDRVGLDLSLLDAQLGRLALAVEEGEPITPDLIDAEVAMSREEDPWAIQLPLLSGNPAFVLQRLSELIDGSGLPTQVLMFFTVDLARKLHAASRLLREGVAQRSVMGQVGLWGDGSNEALRVAQAVDPALLAALLDDCVEADRRSKSGFSSDRRALELLAVRFVTTTAAARR